MKKLAILMLPLLLVFVVLASGCGKTPGGNTGNTGPVDQINLTVDDFAARSITVKAGAPFKFVDPSDTGGIHIICTGDNAKCVDNPDAPKDLLGQGFQIQPGESKTVTFDKPGTYHIACTLHVNMNMTVVVQ